MGEYMSNQFLTNYSELTFLEKLQDNLRRCKAFAFSVSFIKKAGLVLLVKDIEAALERGVEGKIITSTYQNFTDVESLKIFNSFQDRFPNFQCHLDFDSFHDDSYSTVGFHSKGYIFEMENDYEVLIGSSNITRFALLKNVEWDIAVSEKRDSEVFQNISAEFDYLWNETEALSFEVINDYTNRLNFAIERWDMDYDLSAAKIKPNFMQRKALKELNRNRALGIEKALVIAAAGSGKTYLAAFDALNFNPKRLLYIVHEGSILRKSLETFQEVFGNSVTFGIYDGQSKELDADFVFSTNVTMGANKELFDPETFDYIVIDECHHAVAHTYQEIMTYFKPEFLVGLTATPERMDNEDVFEMFGNNIPYELRLRDAIINDLIVPFKYYGIRDELVDYGLSKAEERKMIAQLSTVEHCEFIKEKIEQFRPDGKLKALAFCRTVNHARMMCEAMEEQGYKTAYLTGHNKVGERIKAYNDLQSDTSDLEILFTVDILNEGVDIPGVNMVLFLRPTESSTVFIQQLGRGLRKYDNKEYVTVLDFIGNSYKRSVQIAFALGSLAKNFILEKKLMKQLVEDDFEALGLQPYGVEIHIDDLSKEEITEYIDNENFNSLKYIKQDYENFKKYTNSETYPKHIDYLNSDVAPDLQRFMNVKIGNKVNSYYGFLKGIGEDVPLFSESQEKVINTLSNYLPLVREHEFIIVDNLIRGAGTAPIETIQKDMAERIPGFNEKQFNHALQYLQEKQCILRSGDTLILSAKFDHNFKEYLQDLIEYGLVKYSIDRDEENDFKLWNSYRMDQVQLRLLRNPGSNQKGTYYYGKTIIIFASLKKDASIDEKINYKDKFLSPNLFQWESEHDLSQNALQNLLNSEEALVFIRKVSSENGFTLPFTYIGRGVMDNPRAQEKNGTWLFDIKMDNELPDYLRYDFGLEN